MLSFSSIQNSYVTSVNNPIIISTCPDELLDVAFNLYPEPNTNFPFKISILEFGGIEIAFTITKSFEPSFILTVKVKAVVVLFAAVKPINICLFEVVVIISVSLLFESVTSVDRKLFAIVYYPPNAIAKGIEFGSLSPSIVTVDGIDAVAAFVATSKTETKAVPL